MLSALLPQIKDMLVIKKRQAEILIEFMENCRYQGKELTDEQWNLRESLCKKINELNQKPGKGKWNGPPRVRTNAI